MLDTVRQLLKKVDDFIPKSEKEAEEFRLVFLGKKGKLNEHLKRNLNITLEDSQNKM